MTESLAIPPRQPQEAETPKVDLKQAIEDQDEEHVQELYGKIVGPIDPYIKDFAVDDLNFFRETVKDLQMEKINKALNHLNDRDKFQKEIVAIAAEVVALGGDFEEYYNDTLEFGFSQAVVAAAKKEIEPLIFQHVQMPQLFDMLAKNDFDGLRKVIGSLDNPSEKLQEAVKAAPGDQKLLIERMLGYAKVLEDAMSLGLLLSPLDALLISLAVEAKGRTGEFYLHKEDEGLSKAVAVGEGGQHVFVLLKKEGQLQETGATKRATDAVMLVLDEAKKKVQATPTLRLVNIAKAQKALSEKRGAISPKEAKEIVAQMKKEVALAKKFNDDVFLVVEHTNKKGRAKLTIVEMKYEHNLAHYLSHKSGLTLSQQEVGKILLAIAQRLKKIHAEGFVHNDLKAANIMLTIQAGKLHLKIGDFGSAYNESEEYPRVQKIGYGSAIYSAPETFNPDLKLKDPIAQGQAEEMYALGCLLYSMIMEGKEIPWALGTRQEILRAAGALNERAFTHMQEQHEKIQLLAEEAGDPNRRSQLQLVAKLLHPNPAHRMKLPDFEQEVTRVFPS